MKQQDTIDPILFSIGQACHMCNVTPRTLRYYEKIGLIQPDEVRETSGYRYYSLETMERVQTIRYYHEEGFSLETIREMLDTADYLGYLDFYEEQIQKTQRSIEQQQQKLYHLKACQALLLETKDVIRHQQTEIGVRYIPRTECLQYSFEAKTDSDPVRVHTEGYISFLGDGLGQLAMVDLVGGYSVFFPSLKQRLDNISQKIRLIQPIYPHASADAQSEMIGGFKAVTCHHIGSMRDLSQTYGRMVTWAGEHGFDLQGSAMERPLWWDLSPDQDHGLAMELLLPVNEDCDEAAQLDELRKEINIL